MSAVPANLNLQVRPHPTDVNSLQFVIDYDILFTVFDVNSKLVYLVTHTLIGVDTPADQTGPPPDPTTAGGNDMLFSFLEGVAGSQATQHFTRTFTVPRTTADEDQPPIPNPDELQWSIRLEPQLPTAVTNVSNIVKINLP